MLRPVTGKEGGSGAIVVLSPCGDLHGLTRRELELLGLLIAGRHNAQAAQRLVVTQHTIATHVEHILTKLDAETRALAAVRAQRRGLYIPPALLAHDEPTSGSTGSAIDTQRA